jgi:peptidoglycan/LPS O-acetylase OafA/YrhL
LKSLETINNKNRISSLDIFRGVAIIIVVLFHFDYLNLGYLGVDLFFVISGLLVSRPLLNSLKNDEKISFWKFFLSRGFKIWPSFYFFIFLASVIAIFAFNPISPTKIIDLNYLPRYLFFYKNYSPPPHFWTFDHIWSLCVEEHFYILLPLIFIILDYLRLNKKNTIFFTIVLLVVFGIASKLVGYITKFAEYPSYTNNRIDALSLGVLISYIRIYNQGISRNIYLKAICISLGVVISFLVLNLREEFSTEFNETFFEHSLAPLAFALLIFGLYDLKLNQVYLKPMSFISYYSYNWYLWHPLVATYCKLTFGSELYSLILYLIISFVVGLLATIFIEENALKYRDTLIKKWINQTEPIVMEQRN